MYIFERAMGVMLNFGPKTGYVKVCLAQRVVALFVSEPVTL